MATAIRKHGEMIEIKMKDPITADERLKNVRRDSAKNKVRKGDTVRLREP